MSASTSSLPKLPENPSLFTRLRVGLQALKVLQVEPTNPAYGALFYDSVEIGLCAERGYFLLRRTGCGFDSHPAACGR